MEKEEFMRAKRAIHAEAELKLQALCKEFAFSKNSHSVGDVIRDHIGKGKILAIKYTSSSFYSENVPSCVYLCEELKVNGEPKKKPSTRHMYPFNILTP